MNRTRLTLVALASAAVPSAALADPVTIIAIGAQALATLGGAYQIAAAWPAIGSIRVGVAMALGHCAEEASRPATAIPPAKDKAK